MHRMVYPQGLSSFKIKMATKLVTSVVSFLCGAYVHCKYMIGLLPETTQNESYIHVFDFLRRL
jgi:hypothetical protein